MMILQILIGISVGTVLGALQVWVLKKVVKAVTQDDGLSIATILLALVQFLVTVVALVGLGFYAMMSVLAAGLAMVVSAIVVWVVTANQAGKGGNDA